MHILPALQPLLHAPASGYPNELDAARLADYREELPGLKTPGTADASVVAGTAVVAVAAGILVGPARGRQAQTTSARFALTQSQATGVCPQPYVEYLTFIRYFDGVESADVGDRTTGNFCRGLPKKSFARSYPHPRPSQSTAYA